MGFLTTRIIILKWQHRNYRNDNSVVPWYILYCWIGMGTQLLSPNFSLGTTLDNDMRHINNVNIKYKLDGMKITNNDYSNNNNENNTTNNNNHNNH